MWSRLQDVFCVYTNAMHKLAAQPSLCAHVHAAFWNGLKQWVVNVNRPFIRLAG